MDTVRAGPSKGIFGSCPSDNPYVRVSFSVSSTFSISRPRPSLLFLFQDIYSVRSAYIVMADGYASRHDFSWENDPAFGIVHPTGCGIYRHYMTHLAAAATDAEHHPTFKSALEMRDSAYNTQFLSGVVEGRRLQRDHDMDQLYQLKACRAERNGAIEQTQILSAQLHTSQEELELVKQQFHALRILFEEMVEVRSRESVWEEQGLSSVPGDEQENSQSSAFESCRQTLHDSMSGSSSSDIDEPSSIPSQSDNNFPMPPLPPPTVSVSTTTGIQASDLATPTTILQMQSLMNDGCRPGKTEALSKVRTLYTKAQLTPRQQQSDLQQFLLLQWKGPSTSLISSDMNEYKLRRNREPPATEEVFVDSSPSWGIGFMMSGRWLAWKFKDGWRSGGNRDNHWAEIVAVELGLRVAIAAGSCHHPQAGPLVIRSDNLGVVHSLITGKERNLERMAILRNIQQLGHTYNIEVTPRWISTKENPADGPSRGIFPSRSLLFPSPPPLPVHLAQYLESPVAFNSLSY